ncbi:MAG: 50S ribosomal protein L10 [Actinobacteria bacterium]|jgi:large subunit ribosomal protein L10|nr:50S ribosomal protein L10 [Actinomycetota bacterium]
MARPNKATSVAELADHFRESNAAVLTEYRGLTVAQLKTLRRTLGSTVTYAVVKNTLTKIAAKEAGVTGVDDMLAGPSAIAFVRGDAVDAAKVIKNFAKENPNLVIKGGYMDGKSLSAADIQKIADLESREVLLSKLAGAMKAKQSQAAALFAAPLAKAARALGALQAKLEADPAAVAAVDPAAAPAEEATSEAPAEASADEAPAEAPAEATEAAAPAEAADTAETPADAAVEETTEG